MTPTSPPLRIWHDNGAAVLDQYGFGPHSRLEIFSISENATYRVSDPDSGRVAVLRLSRPGERSRAEILSEIAWIRALRTSGTARTPAVIDTLAGAPIATFHDATGAAQFATLFDFVPGRMLDETNAEAAFVDLGETAARLHGFNETWRRPPGFVRPHWDIETAMGRQGRWGYWGDNATVGAAERDLLARVDAKIRAEIGAYGRPPARHGLIHGDMRMANFIVDPGGIQLIDFDDCGISWHLYELACALTFVEHAPETPALVAAWLRGYTRLRPLDAADLAVLPAMVMLRRMLLVGWFHTHGHVTELHDLSQRYVPQTMEIGAAFLRGAYLAMRGA